MPRAAPLPHQGAPPPASRKTPLPVLVWVGPVGRAACTSTAPAPYLLQGHFQAPSGPGQLPGRRSRRVGAGYQSRAGRAPAPR